MSWVSYFLFGVSYFFHSHRRSAYIIIQGCFSNVVRTYVQYVQYH
jgi:hypothetical protein